MRDRGEDTVVFFLRRPVFGQQAEEGCSRRSTHKKKGGCVAKAALICGEIVSCGGCQKKKKFRWFKSLERKKREGGGGVLITS